MAAPTAATVARRLAATGVEAVALAVVGPDGVTRVKIVPLRRFEDVAKVGVGLSNAFSVFLVNDTMTSAPGIEGPAGDTRLIPDPSSAVALRRRWHSHFAHTAKTRFTSCTQNFSISVTL